MLRGRLIEKIQKIESERGSAAKRTPTAKERTQEKQRPVTPRSPKEYDEKAFLRALNTPLPASTSPAPRRREREKATPAVTPVVPRRRTTRTFSVVRLLIGFLAIAFAAGAVYTRCQGQVNCVGVCREYVEGMQKFMMVHSQQGLNYLQSKSAAANEYVGKHRKEVLHMCKASASRGMKSLIRLQRVVQEAIASTVRSVEGGQRSSEEKSKHLFDGKLNRAVLQSVLGQRRGEEWDQLNLQVANLWQGERMSESKANTILFACDSQSACQHLEAELAAAAPVESTLILSPGDLAAGKGELQARLSHFLKSQPRGVVLIPNIDKAPFSSLSVLCAAMGEYGAFELDGSDVSTSGATFLLTWLAPPAIMQEDSAYSFTTAAKKELVLLLLRSATHTDGSSSLPEGAEDVRAQVHAFRRRIDLVALSQTLETNSE